MRLHVHHLELRSKGGPTKQHNLGAVCSLCHALIHAGFIIIRGHNAETLRFEDRDGNPLSGPGETVPLKVLVRMELAFKRGKGFKVSADGTDEGAAATPLTLELPDEVDTAWWQRNANRIQSRAARGLVYDPAAPLREEPDAAKDAAEEIQGDEHAFDKVVGRGELTERLEQQVRGCATLGRPMPHVLFTGPAGTGKTTIAKAIATRLGSRLVRKNGPDLNDVAALVRLLASLQKGDVLFVDEIHAVPRGVLEILYQAMDEQRLSLTFQEGAVEKPVVLTVSPFTLLAATTHPAKLPQPLRTRMGIREQLRRYEAEDLATLARMAAAAENFSLDEDAARILGGLSRGIPREVERLADTLVVAGAAQGRTALDVAFAKSVMAKEGFDTLGLRPVDRDVLEVLRGCVDENGKVGAPMGLERLAERTGTDRETVLREIEPELERLGLLRIGPGGRRITPRGIHWLRTRDGRPLDFKGFAARHTCGRSQRAAGDARLGSRRAD